MFKLKKFKFFMRLPRYDRDYGTLANSLLISRRKSPWGNYVGKTKYERYISIIKKKKPILYYFQYKTVEFLKPAIILYREKIGYKIEKYTSRIKYFFNKHLFKRWHIVDTGLKPSYYDEDYLILYATLACFKRYLKNEYGNKDYYEIVRYVRKHNLSDEVESYKTKQFYYDFLDLCHWAMLEIDYNDSNADHYLLVRDIVDQNMFMLLAKYRQYFWS